MGEVSTIGLDLAKEVMPPAQSCFESDCAGLLSCNSLQLKRRAELRWKLARLSHYWGRELSRLGHEVLPIPPSYVKPS